MDLLKCSPAHACHSLSLIWPPSSMPHACQRMRVKVCMSTYALPHNATHACQCPTVALSCCCSFGGAGDVQSPYLQIDRCLFENNTCTGNGGALMITSLQLGDGSWAENEHAWITNCTFRNNTSVNVNGGQPLCINSSSSMSASPLFFPMMRCRYT